jgi:hypothetical protein
VSLAIGLSVWCRAILGNWKWTFKIKGSLNRLAEGLIRSIGAMKRQQILTESDIYTNVKHFPARTFRKPKD